MFSGVGGLDIAVAAATGGKTVFVADVCKFDKDGKPGHYEPHRSPCSVLAYRFPGVPNLGDVSLIDWSPWRGLVEIICAGFPCQDVSVAGGRAGLRDGTRTGLWSQVVRAITELQPRLVVLENVPGIFTAPAAGEVEPCPWCLGVGDDEYGLRALDAVLADLASVGFDADWTVVPASGVGAAHKRERWFCAAYPAGQPWSVEHGDSRVAADAGGDHSRGLPSDGTDYQSLPNAVVALLPTPAVNAMGAAYTPETWDAWTAEMKAKHNNGNGHGKSLNVEAQRLLPTPQVQDERHSIANAENRKDSGRQEQLAHVVGQLLPTLRATDGTKGGPNQRGSSGDLMLPSAVNLLPTPTAMDSKASGACGYDSGHDGTTLTDATVRQPAKWGEYEPAIRRWEALTRPAPEPTKLNAKGNPKLSDLFDEWLMGLPAGWITDVPGITWNEVLKACGNGVVPQQAEAAIRWLLARIETAA
jgi:DNA (cytosine-5)-methyltransferase 1